MVGTPQPLEGHHVGRHGDHAGRRSTAQRKIGVELHPAAAGIDREMHSESTRGEVDRRLQDADMGLHPADHDVGAIETCEPWHELWRVSGREVDLLDNGRRRQPVAEPSRGVPELARDVLGKRRRHAERRRGDSDKIQRGVSACACRLGHGGGKPLLYIDDQELRTACLQQWRGRSRRERISINVHGALPIIDIHCANRTPQRQPRTPFIGRSLTEPTQASSGFAELGLCEEVVRAVSDAGYTEPTPIQAKAIPHILNKQDLVGIAQTGTGKTAAFVLPIIHHLSRGRARARMPRSIILSPTRELASQTADNFTKYGKHLKLTMALIIGGVGMGDQEKLLARGVDVLIATPGRLLDWFERGKVLLGGVDTFVIDEADRMLDMGFIPDVERIAGLIARREQTLLFSATMPKEVRRLASQFLREPVEVQVARPATASATIEARLIRLAPDRKVETIDQLIGAHAVAKAIIFCNRKRDVGTLTRKLQRKGYNARDLHGDLEQAHRQATLDAFKAGEVDYLVATDVAARGLDISDMPVVINLDVPNHADDYVHRIGRTGRAGRQGRAFTFATDDDAKRLAKIEQLLGGPITTMDPFVSTAEPVPPVAAGDDAPEPTAEPPRSRAPSDRRRRAAKPAARSQAKESEPAPAPVGPVLGLGDHVPSFLLRPVPIRRSSDGEDS